MPRKAKAPAGAKTYQAHADAIAAKWKQRVKWDAERSRWMVRCVKSSCWLADVVGATDYDLHKEAERLEPGEAQLMRLLRAVLTVHPDIAVTADEWDKTPHHLGTPAGVWDLDDAAEVGSGLDFRVTRRTGARMGNANDCPVWRAFLLQCARGDQGVVDYIQRWCGYCLSGYTNEHACVFVHGPGGNGKTVFVETLTAALGDYACTLPMDSLMDRDTDRIPNDIAMLRGARLAVASETQEGRRWDEARLKSITGGDKISARFMRGEWFAFVPSFKLLIMGNHAPQVSSVDDALRRRLHILPFTNKPPVPDPELKAKLLMELRGILGWCLEGFAAWREQGLNAPESVLAATNEYFDDQDSMGAFLAECTVAEHEAQVSSGRLCEAYKAWAERNNYGSKSAKRLAAELKKRGWQMYRTAHERGFKGMRLLYVDGHGNQSLPGMDDG